LGGEIAEIPKSKHFNDQAEMYQKGAFKDVLFYKEDVEKMRNETTIPENRQINKKAAWEKLLLSGFIVK
jgi:hypothetical protein